MGSYLNELNFQDRDLTYEELELVNGIKKWYTTLNVLRLIIKVQVNLFKGHFSISKLTDPDLHDFMQLLIKHNKDEPIKLNRNSDEYRELKVGLDNMNVKLIDICQVYDLPSSNLPVTWSWKVFFREQNWFDLVHDCYEEAVEMLAELRNGFEINKSHLK